MNKGIAVTILAYFIWGFMPVFFKTLQGVPSFQVAGYRVIASFCFVAILLTLIKGWNDLRRIQGRVLPIYLASGMLLLANWLVYIWGVQNGYVIESSLGYFINPLVSVVLGVIFLKEKLRPLQWYPVGLAGAGVVYLTVSYGSIPWIAVALALTFGFYALVKKLAPLGSIPGLVLETAFCVPVAVAYLAIEQLSGTGLLGRLDAGISLLLLASGVVTGVPFLLFATGTRTVPLSLMGILFYISPTLQFISGMLFFDEPFSISRQIGFGIIWMALLIYSLEGYLVHRRRFRLSEV